MSHLVAGVSHWEFGSFRVYPVNPPLTRLLAAIPVVASRPKMDWKHFHGEPGGRPESQLGRDFAAANPECSQWFCTLARWMCIPFSWLGAWICFRWARELFSERAGLLALSFWCFSPNILGNAMLITPDTGATAFGLAASYAFWRWLKTPQWSWTVTSGIALGIAELTKFTWLVLFIWWPLLWISWRPRDATPRSDLRRWGGQGRLLAFSLVLALYTIGLGYGLEGLFQPLGKFHFVSKLLADTDEIAGQEVARPGTNRFANSLFANAPIPLPKNFVVGVDLQKRDCESYPGKSYLRGVFQDRGWWYFYLYALAIKLPLGFLILFAIACAIHVMPEPNGPSMGWRDTSALLGPAAIILGLLSSQTAFTIHLRYVLPALPYLFIWCSRVVYLITPSRRLLAPLVVGTSLWCVSSSLWIYPHSLSYFNELVGGPNHGSAHLIDSNLDWGQDLIYLKDWLATHPHARPLKLAYFGNFDPRHVGIDYELPKPTAPSDDVANVSGGPKEYWCAISVGFLRGASGLAPSGDGHWKSIPAHSFDALRTRQPDAQAGYSIYIYQLGFPTVR
jgi:hypothetical protein